MALFHPPNRHETGDVHGRRGGRGRLVVIVLGVVSVALAACGSASAKGSGTSTTTKPAAASQTAYTKCLKQHGVNTSNFPGRNGAAPGGGTRTPGSGSFPGGGGGGGLFNNPTFQKAAAACKSLRPAGGAGGFGRGGAGGANSTAFAAYRNCLTLHGVTLPTPGASSGAGSSTPTTLNASSPTVKAAEQACAALRPSGTPSSTTTTG